MTIWTWLGRARSVGINATTASAANHSGGSNQVQAYNHFVANVSAEWVGIIDLDDFIFGVNITAAKFVRQLPMKMRQVCMCACAQHRALSPESSRTLCG